MHSQTTLGAWLDLSRFEFSADAGPAAVLTLEAELGRGERPPKDLLLVARRGMTVTTYRPTWSTLERLAGSRRASHRARLRLTAGFQLPPAMAGDLRITFELVSTQREPVLLPQPGWCRSQHHALLELKGPRRGAAALASAAALLGTFGAAPAFADGTSTTATQPTSTTTATTATTPTTTTSPPTTTTPVKPPPPTTSSTPRSPKPPPSTTPTTPSKSPTPPAKTSTTKKSSSPPKASKNHTSTHGTGTHKSKPDHKRAGHKGHSRHHNSAGHHRSGHHASNNLAGHHQSQKGHHNATHKGRHHLSGAALAALQERREELQDATHPDTVIPVPGSVSSPGSSSLTVDPLTSAQLKRYAEMVGGLRQPPKYLVKIYKAAARHFRIPWQVLAAINYVETRYGQDLAVSPAGAVGWMQFMPSTWARYGMAVTAKGRRAAGQPNPWNPSDAIFAAARYLTAAGARHNLPRAIFAYNHAGWYVQEVLSIAQQITRHGLKAASKAGRRIAAMNTTARLLNGLPYVWGGGHATFSLVSPGYDCSGFVSSVLHAGGFLRTPVTTQSLPSQPGIRSGPGRWVTIFDRTYAGITSDHVIINIAGQWWESGGWGVNASRVHRMRHVSVAYLQTFNLVLHPKGL